MAAQSNHDQLPAYLFVYGTLKKGYHNNVVLEGAEFVDNDVIAGHDIYDLGHYPCVVVGDGYVAGEVYRVSREHLAKCDRLEGYPSYYNRRRVTTQNGHSAWVYYWEKTPAGRKKLESGKWPEERGKSK